MSEQIKKMPRQSIYAQVKRIMPPTGETTLNNYHMIKHTKSHKKHSNAMEQPTEIKEPLSQNNRQTVKNRRKYDPKRSQAAFLRPTASKLAPGAETDPKKSN